MHCRYSEPPRAFRLVVAVALILTVALGLRAAPRQALAQAPADDALTRAEAAIGDELTKAGAPGAAVALVVGDRVAWARGFGVANVETGVAVTPDTLFQIGSATKSFTAAAILSANAEGTIARDRPVSTYVSGLAPCVGAPTLTQLLSHTGGLIDEPDEFGPQGEEGLGAYARTWTSEYCLLDPGRAFSYSNSGFALAGLALQEADKKPFADVMRTRVLGPIGMPRTTFRPTEAMTWPIAVGHRKDKEGRVTVVRPLANDARLWPAGTLYSSANEMARFVLAVMNDGKVEGRQVLPAGVAATMQRAVAEVPTTGQHYAQGLFIDGGGKSFGHGGTMTGYTAQMTTRVSAGAIPAIGAVVLVNGDNANPDPIMRLALDAARAASGTDPTGGPSAAGEPSPERRLSAAEAAGFVGRYSNPRRFTVEVVQQGDGLILKRFGRDFPMRAVEAPGSFLVDLPRGGTETIAFGIGAGGRADYLQMNVWALARVP